MLIKSIRITNLRSYRDEIIEFDPYTCLVGANGAGKSTVLCALNIFFRETESSSMSLSNLEKEDFHNGNVAEPIEITVVFENLSDAAKSDFSQYYRHSQLIVTAKAIFDPITSVAVVKQYGNRLAMSDFAPFFKALGDGSKVSELQGIYSSIRDSYPDLPTAKTKDSMTSALHDYEMSRPDECILIPSEDQFYGVSQGQGLLRKYVQWVYIPAVKDAAGEQAESRNTALGRLLARTVRAQVNFSEKLLTLRAEAEQKYRDMMSAEQGVLDSISLNLQHRLAEWSHPDATAKLTWHQDPKSSIRIEEPMARLLAGDGEFEGSIARFGHGLQRSYIIALLQGLVSTDDEDSPTLILGCEEPELYQHPPQARHLATVLQTLSERNSQVVVSTHSPYFVDGAGFERVRVVRKPRHTKSSIVRACTLSHIKKEYARVIGKQEESMDATLVQLHQAMQPQLSEMFFASKIVLVEGLEDVAYLKAWLLLSNQWRAFQAAGAHIILVNAKSELIRPIIIAQKMQIPAYVIFDCDGSKTHKDPGREAQIRASHERDNRAIFSLMGLPEEAPFSASIRWGEHFTAWPDELGDSVKADAGDQWIPAGNSATAACGGAGSLQKNTMHIAARLRELRRLGVELKILDQVCQSILLFVNRH